MMKPKTGRVEDTDDRTISRRDLIKTGAAIAAAAAMPLGPDVARAAQGDPALDDGGTLEKGWRDAADPKQRLLLKGGTIVSMDPKIGDLVSGDILIEGKKIAAVGAALQAPAGAQVIDATGTIIIPG